ncbi:hypothetical protein LEP1GSC103_3165 [Leptospira borgpetersenii serovar Javanica str. UI 09931]|uniref:Uncharacterized protein n=5 Tax=Leptospira borgpetersenii TaxID=174 RepID=M3GSN0_LEPBO|nr:hypothetical protein LBBP_02046 [Leptospira borgpetersenii serovar Ballum]EKP14189.1 hypothetical protein LEP1GSC128_2917 [Leptospira borgpetersenii str. 200801926]EKQ90679.1 hypothetical protein LEP1GSC101_0600 [Leptospira borgpetersenii str. UI 09149]EMF97848.1 hypothetical protein LEP1GSC123_4225 [Leptospira borgpetersenii str. 200701203]EMK13122.1 hypothetical protein LEP1GSC066_3434 [Leptospira sp. serovar Kenya str. Sh9]EMN15006.1 hypothetical protein LEP1GSC055_2624 [Leptospira borgp
MEWSYLFVNDARSLYLFIPSNGKFRKIKDFLFQFQSKEQNIFILLPSGPHKLRLEKRLIHHRKL